MTVDLNIEWEPTAWAWQSPDSDDYFQIVVTWSIMDAKRIEIFLLHRNGQQVGQFTTLEKATEHAVSLVRSITT